MNQDTEKTRVLFLQYPDNDTIALFPDIPYNDDSSLCMSYQHQGQHGAAAKSLETDLRRATAEEYDSLKKELESIGYNLTII